ncbi:MULTISPECIES: acyl carrier protein [Streptomyces]|uniref:Acyl carrier protein n=2 Tax=Streptomyces buecherae TaxID=2763006 RepID=A0A7H8N504_9ACTN|nr:MULTISPECIES: acyl carrier protein [Streptomyces]QKW49540.1 acyl carrier protein [Streptomyces buecherae]WEV28197.1 acyl carrier protein [Streptomyces sp. 71268]
MSATYDRLIALLTKLHEAPPEDTTPDATYAELDVDSLTLVEIVMHVERELGVTIEDSELHPDLSLGATAKLIDERLAG